MTLQFPLLFIFSPFPVLMFIYQTYDLPFILDNLRIPAPFTWSWFSSFLNNLTHHFSHVSPATISPPSVNLCMWLFYTHMIPLRIFVITLPHVCNTSMPMSVEITRSFQSCVESNSKPIIPRCTTNIVKIKLFPKSVPPEDSPLFPIFLFSHIITHPLGNPANTILWIYTLNLNTLSNWHGYQATLE